MDRDICFVDHEAALIKAAQTVKNSIIVVEEVDTLAGEKRDESNSSLTLEKKDEVSGEDKFFRSLNKRVLGKILNALDGIFSNHGRIIIMTTNHADILDPALLRPGRIDLQIEVGHMCSETLNSFLKRFFSDYEPRHINIKDGVSPAEVQGDIILGMGPKALIKKYSHERKHNETEGENE